MSLKTSSGAMGLRRMEEICGLIRALADARALTGVGVLVVELALAFERAGCDLRAAEADLLARMATQRGDSLEIEPQRRSGAGRVLLAEHDALIAKFISASLKASGLEITHVTDGSLALASATENSPDVFLLSATLPMIDGYELLSRFRLEKRLRSSPVIILSQRHQEQDVLRAFELGADDFMSQPLNPLELAARTRRLVRSR
jgi:PleD family two-component response regulator